MKRFFKIFGLLTFLYISILYSEKAITVVRELDDLMIRIEKEKNNYTLNYQNASILNHKAIPGLNGRKVNINKSYHNMKRLGSFNPNLFEYDEIYPKISLKNNFNNYIISGNSKKDFVSLVFTTNSSDSIDDIIEILKEKKVPASFFLNNEFFLENQKIVNKMNKNDNLLGIKIDDYMDKDDFNFLEFTLKQLSKNNNYCYFEKENNDYLKLCSKYKNYSLIPSIIVYENPLKEIKDEIKPGQIISLPANDIVSDQLRVIITYINSRGYKIVSLDDLFSEKLDGI